MSSSRLKKAKFKLDTLNYYPEKVRVEGVRVIVAPLFFTLFFPRFHGFALTKKTILMRYKDYSDGLLTHELCHLWQTQQDGLLRTAYSYFLYEYMDNPYEREARQSVAETLTIYNE